VVGPFTPSEQPMADVAATEAPAKTGLAGFLATTLGKIVVGGAIVIVIAGALAAIAFFFFLSRATDEVGLIVPPINGQTSSVASAPVEPPAQRPSPRLDNTFTFRNVFRPTVRPAVPASDTVEASSTAEMDLPPDTLFLESVSTVDGAAVATLLWNGQVFTAGEGDRLEGTPWQVISISGNSVVMLYGDTRVTLVVGQGVGK